MKRHPDRARGRRPDFDSLECRKLLSVDAISLHFGRPPSSAAMARAFEPGGPHPDQFAQVVSDSAFRSEAGDSWNAGAWSNGAVPGVARFSEDATPHPGASWGAP